jgi:hypothetical protein
MAIFITGLVLFLIPLLANVASQFGITFIYDAFTVLPNLLGMSREAFMRLVPLIGTILMVVGYVQIQRAKRK